MPSRSKGRRSTATSAKARRAREAARAFGRSVFINCPFDDGYRPLFRAIVFTIADAGFRARCALEAADSGEVRVDKIARILRSCRFGIHDISRTESSGAHKLPRFNMPFELGLDLGARKYGEPPLHRKVLLILDREPYRYQMFLSDIAGQDIQAHGGNPVRAVHVVRDWLRTSGASRGVPGEKAIAGRLALFEQRLPAMCARLGVGVESLIFADLVRLILAFLRAQGR